ncbi:MAG: lipopolysaccharide heptosyltransferase II [bacterium]|nr:lipopolysaccharide heptosyltransferase II [bacterium]
MNIAIRSPNWIGDCIMTLPAIREIKKRIPASRIYLVVKDYLRPVYENIEEIEEIIRIPNGNGFKDLLQGSKILKSYNFREGLLFANSFNSALLFRLAGIRKLTGYKKDLRGFLLSNAVMYPRDNRHHIYFYLDLAKQFLYQHEAPDYSNDSSGIVTTPAERQAVSVKLTKMGIRMDRPLLGISPSAAYGSAKQWMPERFSQLIAKIQKEKPAVQILLFGSQKEREKIAAIIRGTVENDHIADGSIYNLAGLLDLRQALVAISFCSAFVSNDSGLMHIASALSIPLVALFGPTRPAKTSPLNDRAVVIHYPPECSPCLHRDCPYDGHPCMSAITVDEVFETLSPLLPPAGATNQNDE